MHMETYFIFKLIFAFETPSLHFFAAKIALSFTAISIKFTQIHRGSTDIKRLKTTITDGGNKFTSQPF